MSRGQNLSASTVLCPCSCPRGQRCSQLVEGHRAGHGLNLLSRTWLSTNHHSSKSKLPRDEHQAGNGPCGLESQFCGLNQRLGVQAQSCCSRARALPQHVESIPRIVKAEGARALGSTHHYSATPVVEVDVLIEQACGAGVTRLSRELYNYESSF